MNCALVPPPRFVLEDSDDDRSPSANFHQVSFCGADGVERLLVHRWDDVARDAEDSSLLKVAKSLARTLHVQSGVRIHFPRGHLDAVISAVIASSGQRLG